MSPVPGDVLPEAELPLEAAELPEGAALEAVVLETVALGVAVLEAVLLPVLVVVAEAGRAALAVVLPAATLAVATCG